MGLEKFLHPSLYMGIPVVSYCCHGMGLGNSYPMGIYPLPTLPPSVNQIRLSFSAGWDYYSSMIHGSVFVVARRPCVHLLEYTSRSAADPRRPGGRELPHGVAAAAARDARSSTPAAGRRGPVVVLFTRSDIRREETAPPPSAACLLLLCCACSSLDGIPRHVGFRKLVVSCLGSVAWCRSVFPATTLTRLSSFQLYHRDVNGEFLVGECFPIYVPTKCHEEDFLFIYVLVWGVIPIRFPIHISLCDFKYSHIHEFILMIYKQILSTKIHI